MQKGDFGKRAVMKYLCVKCRWGGLWWLEVPGEESGMPGKACFLEFLEI